MGAAGRPRLPGIEQRVKVLPQRLAGDADPATDADSQDQPGMVHAAEAALTRLPNLGRLPDVEQSKSVIRGVGPPAGWRTPVCGGALRPPTSGWDAVHAATVDPTLGTSVASTV